MLAKVADMLCSVQFEVEVQYAGHRGHGWWLSTIAEHVAVVLLERRM